jgi:polyisoprenoid-binding protein YceI
MKIGGTMKPQWIFGFSVVLIAAIGSVALAADVYRIDSQKSHITADVGTGGVFGFAGHSHHIVVGNLSGNIQAPPKSPESASAEIRVVSDSLSEDGEFKEEDLQKINTEMKQSVLETSQYPEILFKSTKVSATPGKEGQYQVQIEGNLTLHGVTQKVVIPAAVTLGEKELYAVGEFKFNREDYKIETASPGGGTVKVGKEIKISFEIIATP